MKVFCYAKKKRELSLDKGKRERKEKKIRKKSENVK